MVWHHTVWPEAELVYTSVAKVANTSIKTCLLASFHPDVARRAPHSPEMPYVSVHPNQIRTTYPGYCHFAVVRHPLDRLVSFWADKIVGPTRQMPSLERLGMLKGMSFPETVRMVAAVEDRRADGHFRSQSFLLTDRRGEIRPDLLLRFERLEDDWDLLRWLVAERTGAQIEALPRRRVSNHRDFRDHYDDETWALAAERYAADLELFAYPREREPRPAAGDHDGDGAVDRQLARVATAPLAVLDLTTPTAARVASVVGGGGRYLGRADGSPLGTLAKLSALENGRIDPSCFDVLVVRRSDLGPWSPPHALRDGFAARGRPVIVVPEHLGPVLARILQRVSKRAVRQTRATVKSLRSAGSRRWRRFRGR